METEGEKQAYTLILRGKHTTLADTGNIRDNEREAEEEGAQTPSPASQQIKEREALT